MEKQK